MLENSLSIRGRADLPAFLQREETFGVFCLLFSIHQAPMVKGSIPKRKNVLLGSKLISITVDPLDKRDKTVLNELLPL